MILSWWLVNWQRRDVHAAPHSWKGAQEDLVASTIIDTNCTMSRKTQMRKPAGNKAWTMEIDPTNSLLASLTSGKVPATAGIQQTNAAAPSNTVQHYQRVAQPSTSNGCFSSITADQTPSQARFSPLPTSVQFDSNAVGGHMLKPTVSVAPCDMTLSVSTKQLQVLVTGCVKQQLFRRVKFFDDDLHGHFDYNPDSVCGMVRNFCNVSSIETNLQWWYETRSKIKRTLGNHRNNCIKTMRSRFRGTCNSIVSFTTCCY